MTEFFIKGKVHGKGRPRFTRSGHCYTDEKTKAYENLTALSYKAQTDGKCYSEPLQIIVSVFFLKPKSAAKRIFPTVKPDADNIAKIILDGLNGVAYEDDKQIVKLIVYKYYTTDPVSEGTKVMISEVK